MKVTDQFRLEGKTALVTGCCRGLGKAMAIALAEAGANIIGVSHALEASGSSVEKEVQKRDRQFTAYRSDFADRDDLYRFIKEVKAKHKAVDILVNNAGTILRAPAAEHSDEYWDKVIAINLNSQFILTREFGKSMVERGSGKVIFTCSLLTFQGGINVPSYSASKGGVGQLVKAFANEWSSKGVQVNGIAPGYIATENTEALRADPVRSKDILSRIPANRWGEPEDFAGPIVFLASQASNYVSGSIVTVDGGWMAR
ncbi:MAG: SDR family NAD(P)-dependent oxidoreductase [Oligoflexales bacterium]